MSQNAYFESQVYTADPVVLVTMLYRGAIDSIESARQRLAEGDIAGRSMEIARAADILAELTESLDLRAGGEVARNLQELYAYILHRLQDGNFHQTQEPFAEAIQLLSTLLDGWEQIAAQNRSERQFVTDEEHYQPLQCSF